MSSILPSARDRVVTKHIKFGTLMKLIFLWGVKDNKTENSEQLNDTTDIIYMDHVGCCVEKKLSGAKGSKLEKS